MLNPDVAARPCSDCRTYLYMDQGPNRFGERIERPRGTPVLRPKGARTPCQWCPKIPAGDPPVPESAQELTPANFQAFLFYRECKAVGVFPADPWVRAVARVCRDAEEAADRVTQTRTGLMTLGRLMRGV